MDLTKAILNGGEGKGRLTGLGACDSLRLEAHLYLYVNDMRMEFLGPLEREDGQSVYFLVLRSY